MPEGVYKYKLLLAVVSTAASALSL